MNWDQVEEYMHVESGWQNPQSPELQAAKNVTAKSWKEENEKYWATEKELEEIFERTYGPIRKLGEERPAGPSVKAGRGAGEIRWKALESPPEITNRKKRRMERKNTFWWMDIILFLPGKI